MSRYVIGLTGGIACGKSNLSRALVENGAYVIDADAVSRALTQQGGRALPEIRRVFGDAVFCGDQLDRQKLAALVFKDRERLEELNGILHPMVFEEMDRLMQQGPDVCILQVPLLFECGMEKQCDEVWCAYIPQKEQLRRLKQRAGIGTGEALRRIRSQMSALKKARLSDRVIRTDGTREESAKQVLTLYRQTMERLKEQ